MTYLICYDFSDDRLRLRVAKLLERTGCVRVQKSVFMAVRFDLKKMERLRRQLLKIIPDALPDTDSLIVVPIERDLTVALVWAGVKEKVDDALQVVFAKWV